RIAHSFAHWRYYRKRTHKIPEQAVTFSRYHTGIASHSVGAAKLHTTFRPHRIRDRRRIAFLRRQQTWRRFEHFARALANAARKKQSLPRRSFCDGCTT